MSGSAGIPVQIFLLGRFEIVRGERRLRAAGWTRRKAAALFQRLALERRLLKDQAIDFLWPEAGLASGANSLYRTLYALRQTLNETLGPETAEEIFSFADGVLALDESVWVDVHEFKRLSAGQQTSMPVLQQALDLYQGDLLPDDPYSDWLAVPRDTLRRLHREVSIALAGIFQEQQAYIQAISLLTPLLVQDPADEPVHRTLMRLYAQAGRRHDALRQYQSCVEALAEDLDVRPEPETTHLYEQILNGELAPTPEILPGPAEQPLSRSPGVPFGLPVETTVRLVGREPDLECLIGYMEEARSGQGRTVLITGESGLGKTRLASEALQAAAGAGMITLFGAAYEQEGFLAYQPIIEAIDDYLARSEAGPVMDASVKSRPHNPITHFKRAGSSDSEQQSWALFNAVATFLSQLSPPPPTGTGDHLPVVFLLDDLHAADEATLRLFHFLARKSQTSPLILIATYTTHVRSTTSPFGTLLNALYRERFSATLTLSALDEQAVGQILSQILDDEPEPSMVSAVTTITEGNPFFVEEIGRSLVGDEIREERVKEWQLGTTSGDETIPLPLPSGLKDLLQGRVAQLGRPVESMLTTAAVIGRDFEFGVLQGAAGVFAGHDRGDRFLFDALDRALEAHLLDETASGYRFHHPLIRRTLYESLSQVRRARLHAEIAESIEASAARQTKKPEAYVEELAFHYDHSDRREQALDYLIKAGRQAAKLYAYEVALDYYERALSLLDALGLSESRRRFRLLERAGRYHKILADTPRAVAAFEQALGIKGADWEPSPRERARLRRLAALALLTAGRLDEATSHLQQALAELEAGGEKGVELANVLYNISQTHWHRNEYSQAFDVAQQSLAIAERLNDQAAIARAFEMLALACHSLGKWQQGLSFEEQRSALTGPGLEVSDAFDVHL